ncbi:sigma-B regulation protein RsbQ [Pseudoduganella lurida]|uniref:Sigma-B regulation protein RsbQ n=1 Tax=Pseudoduganella lurida TaxID=1036180 RepID=A0A562RLB3_9BURK|nr:alpha/beta hydrolase [Pseudoduganella lurida]TWI69838.1 sigma-B regulation protein RsbQ [Pseudoduganella lurida]
MSIHTRHNIQIAGRGPATLVFGHGYGCDQSMWRDLIPAFARRYRLVTYDLVGSGGSDLAAYDRDKYATLHGHADDLLEIIDACADGPVVFIGHSVSAMIGLLAANKAPHRFIAQVMVGPSPCYVNDADYVGGFNREDLDALLAAMDRDFLGWTLKMAPMIMGAPDRPELAEDLADRILRNDHAIARHFARVTFLADHRADLPGCQVPTLVVQCTDDVLVPREVSQYMYRRLPRATLRVIDNVGHCPHVSAPSDSSLQIERFLTTVLR